jgi:hypothetical protein
LILALRAIFSGCSPWCDGDVPRIRQADVREGALAALARHHEREHARQVGAERHREELEHQRRVIAEGVGDAERLVAELDVHALLPLGALDALLDLRTLSR